VRAIGDEWWWQAHGGQIEPAACPSGAPWLVWSIVAGRGFGKTRAGAEWVWARARAHPGARIALVGASREDVVRVMVEGESGLIAVARCDEAASWRVSRGELRFPSGARAFAYGAAQPEALRGPQHHFAWADEVAKWPRGEAAWHNLMLGLRLGDPATGAGRAVVTTTPQATALMRTILAMERGVVTRGRTAENPHLPADFRAAMTALYGGTRLGRQELDGELFDAPEGALWPAEVLDAGRGTPDGAFERVVIGVDPPASAAGRCGISVCARDSAGILWVVADLSAGGLSPEGWARRVCAAATEWGADLIVAERNQGGDMVRATIRGVDAGAPVRLVSATRAKAARAAPVALRFETGGARLAGTFPALEAEMRAFTYGGHTGEGSPDRVDAMVWAMTALIADRQAARVVGL
jgi:phage terminase large subunit-like protein